MFRLDMFFNKGSEAWAQVAQRAGRYPIPRNIPGQSGWVFRQCDLVEDIPVYRRELD